MKYITTEKLPIKSWCDNPEDGCIEQAKNLANLPFLYKHVALMSDCHQGYGMPIGGVIAAIGVIIPFAVGVDIGCGMCAVKTNLTVSEFSVEKIKAVMGEIRKAVPVGFNRHEDPCKEEEMPIGWAGTNIPIVSSQYASARKQLGTLGGGNHFIEIQKGSNSPFGLVDSIWIMIHSGSRNLGKQVADHYNKIAKELNARWYTKVDPKADLAFLPFETPEAKAYFAEMNYCLAFSRANRAKMLDAIKGCFNSIIPTEFAETLDIQHNYAAWENHFDKNVIIHRKGATMARAGQMGIIPGSQGTSSYIVEGLGNPDSFMSCSHGAGRKMGRKQAERTLILEDEVKLMNDKGIIHAIRGRGDLDEAAGAYKDIQVVMAEQADLVKIVTRLEPMGVIKG